MRATYHRRQGTEQFLGFYDVHADCLSGLFRRRKRLIEVSEAFRRLRDLLRTDRELRRFHEGRSTTLPELYHREYERMLGPYASLMSRADRTPELAGLPRASAGGRHGGRAPADAGAELLGVPV